MTTTMPPTVSRELHRLDALRRETDARVTELHTALTNTEVERDRLRRQRDHNSDVVATYVVTLHGISQILDEAGDGELAAAIRKAIAAGHTAVRELTPTPTGDTRLSLDLICGTCWECRTTQPFDPIARTIRELLNWRFNALSNAKLSDVVDELIRERSCAGPVAQVLPPLRQQLVVAVQPKEDVEAATEPSACSGTCWKCRTADPTDPLVKVVAAAIRFRDLGDDDSLIDAVDELLDSGTCRSTTALDGPPPAATDPFDLPPLLRVLAWLGALPGRWSGSAR